MDLQVNDTFGLDPGVYRAKVVKIEEIPTTDKDTGEPSKFRLWTFDILEEGHEGQQITGGSSMAFGPRSKTRQWVETLMGRELGQGEGLKYPDLFGLECDLGIVHEKKDRGTFPAINAVNPVRKKSRSQEKAEAKGKQAPPSKLDAATEEDLDSIPF